MMLQTYEEYAQAAYKNAKDKGFWDKPKDYDTTMFLIISELAEAMEADRTNSKDDKLPEYDGYWVELADVFIRVSDLVGYYLSSRDDKGWTAITKANVFRDMSKTRLLMHITQQVVCIDSDIDENNTSYVIKDLMQINKDLVGFCNAHGIDLIEIVDAKMKFNSNREKMHGGKRY